MASPSVRAAGAARPRNVDAALATGECVSLCRKAIFWWLPILYLLISDAFYLRTYDSAQVKITLVQMGGTCLVAIWIARLLEDGRRAITRQDLVILAPFLASLTYGILSFWHAPYHWSSTDFFVRRVFYMTVPLIVIHEFNEQAVQRLIRLLIIATWIAAGYGCLQWFDYKFFPNGPGNGIDPFIWRGAFGDRVFSTYGNPNFLADYLVIMFPILVTQWYRSRDPKLLVLLAMDLFALRYTHTKGAWIAFAMTASILVGTFLYFFDRERLRRFRLHLAGAVAVTMAAVLVSIYMKLSTSNFTSVTFRLFTWEATWEMIMTQPLIGTGLGSFWVIYPAFRRPPIFHIEGKHNTETDHAEDEFLEVLFDEGILGFGIFLWLIACTCTIAYRALAQLATGLKPGERAPPRAYELLGFLVAFQGMLLHNFFDVSMRFVSSGVYLGLLPGIIVNLSRGTSLSECHAQKEPSGEPGEPTVWETLSLFFLWPARLAAWGAVGYMGFQVLTQFAELQGPVGRLTFGGEILQWWIAWALLLGCVGGVGFAFLRISGLARNALVPLAIALTMIPVKLAWGFFRADVYHNIAIFYSKQQNWEQALKHYIKVGDLNPAFIMSFYFKGNVFNDRFNMSKIYNPNWGDQGNVARDDFERALEAYDQVRARAPNYVQMHHQVGALYMKRGEWALNQAQAAAAAGQQEKAAQLAAEGQKNWDQALERFEMYRKIDPVFAPNYYRMGQIHMLRRHHDKAIETYRALIEARECRIDPSLTSKSWYRRTLARFQEVKQYDGEWGHRHETGEAYTNLGNAYFMAGNPAEAEKAYLRALQLEPKNQNAAKNLEALRARVQAVNQTPRPPALVPPAGPPAVTFESPSKQR
ncbi:MAG: tetratricopeptide repeat protein [Elusimicrobia bacterium]|nr:tetratricopeptide repeat protein [Elusimicrobiota bacterium]